MWALGPMHSGGSLAPEVVQGTLGKVTGCLLHPGFLNLGSRREKLTGSQNAPVLPSGVPKATLFLEARGGSRPGLRTSTNERAEGVIKAKLWAITVR